MTANIIRLPLTPDGRALLRTCINLARGWSLPDGTNAADVNWDQAVVEADRVNEDFERWRSSRHGGRS